jgi:hypothetical protein
MASSQVRFFEGDEWEHHIQLLLKRHYGPGNYQEVPAKHCGDYGIEGYSMDGCVYQCYATQEPCPTQQRYEAQRNKITTDIRKFIDNKTDLIKLFGETSIRRWILVVPTSESAQLVQHASKKAQEVLDASLPYVADDFKVIVITDSAFAKEINELSNVGVIDIDTQTIDVDINDVDSWAISNDGLVGNLNRKAKKILNSDLETQLKSFSRETMLHYLRGQALLSSFSENYPDIYAHVVNCKCVHERQLLMLNLLNSDPALQYFTRSLKDYSDQLYKSLPSLPSTVIETLKWEGVSDWLMRCPLDF